MRYEKTLTVSETDARKINDALNGKPWFGREKTYMAEFDDGVLMNLRCRGNCNGIASEAVLSANGFDVCMSEEETEFFGVWVLEHKNNEYALKVRGEFDS